MHLCRFPAFAIQLHAILRCVGDGMWGGGCGNEVREAADGGGIPHIQWHTLNPKAQGPKKNILQPLH